MKHRDEGPLDHGRWLDRREFLSKMGTGLGSIALACLLAGESRGATGGTVTPAPDASSLKSVKQPYFPAKARRVLQVFCPGAVSQVDTFEYKPELIRRHGEPMPGEGKIVTFQGGNGSLIEVPGGGAGTGSAASGSRICCPTWPAAWMTSRSSTRSPRRATRTDRRCCR